MHLFIGHIDADCFYVSAERVRHSHLHRMPVGVLGNHGACVIAKSYEMKAYGVSTGMPIWEAVPICPNGIYIKRDFTWYETLSRRMLAVVKEASPLVEYYSVDEMFFAVERPANIAENLQASIVKRVGVPVSVGIARTKLLAKLASDHYKPSGCMVVDNEAAERRLLENLPVTEITGIANRSAKKLADYGIRTCDQFVAADRRLIRRLLTKRGEDIWWELRGESVLAVSPQRPRHKFIARGGSLGRATSDDARLRAFVVRNTERLIEALNFYKLGCDQLILDLSFRPTGGAVLRDNLMSTSWCFEELGLSAIRLLDRCWRGQPVHYMHVIAGRLRDRRHAQRSLFDDDTASGAVDKLKHDINDAMGRFAIRSAATLPLVDVYSDPANDFDICDIYGKSCF